MRVRRDASISWQYPFIARRQSLMSLAGSGAHLISMSTHVTELPFVENVMDAEERVFAAADALYDAWGREKLPSVEKAPGPNAVRV